MSSEIEVLWNNELITVKILLLQKNKYKNEIVAEKIDKKYILFEKRKIIKPHIIKPVKDLITKDEKQKNMTS